MSLPSFDEDRRLLILSYLAAVPGAAANDRILASAVAQLGHRMGEETIAADIALLADAKAVRVERVGPVSVVTLTRDGRDAAAGRVRMPGVAAPLPGDEPFGA